MRTNTRRYARARALLAASVLVLAACGGSEGAETTAASGDGNGEQMELIVWASQDWQFPPDEFAGFMERHPNITVSIDFKPDGDVLQQLQARTEVGERLPDLILEDTFLIESHHAAGMVAPLQEWKDRWEEEDPEEFANILPIAWEEAVLDDGTLMAVGLSGNMEAIYYNVPWFAEAGLDSTTIDSLEGVLNAMRAMKATRPDQIPLTLTALPTTGVTTQKALFSAAGTEFNGVTPNLHSEGGQYVLNWFVQAAAEGLLPPEAISWAEEEAQGAFYGLRAGIIIDGFQGAGDYTREPDFDYGEDWGMMVIPPSRTGAQQDNDYEQQSKSWYITTGSEHPYETSLLIRYINETLVDQALNGGIIPRNTAALEDPRFVEGWPFFTDQIKQAFLSAVSAPVGLNAAEVESILEELFGEIIFGTDLTSEELADKYQPLLDAA